MSSQTPQQKAEYLLDTFNDDVTACISLCDRMINGNIVNCSGYYEKVKQILNNL
jgi:hypothetical protein